MSKRLTLQWDATFWSDGDKLAICLFDGKECLSRSDHYSVDEIEKTKAAFTQQVESWRKRFPEATIEFSSTHGSHCCERHGCKYGDDFCSVEMGLETQEFPCEECDHETKNKFENFTDEELNLLHTLIVWHKESSLKPTPQTEEGIEALFKLADAERKARA